MNRRDALRAWEKLNDGQYDHGNQTDRAAVFLFLLAGRKPGPRLAREACISEEEMREFIVAAERNGIYRDGKIYCGWTDPEVGGIEFIMDAMCLSGLMQRTPTP